MLAWHFVDGILRDGRPVPHDGETLVHDGPIELCESGLHGSARLIDALKYAPGPTICRVDLSGEIKHDDDKSVATERTILWRVNGEELLCRFARRCALDVIRLWDPPDVVVRYLKTGDERLRAAARAAARASEVTAWAAWAAGAAVRDASGAAVRDASGAAVRDASGAAAWDAAKAAGAAGATRDAARESQNRRLTAMVMAERRRQGQGVS